MGATGIATILSNGLWRKSCVVALSILLAVSACGGGDGGISGQPIRGNDELIDGEILPGLEDNTVIEGNEQNINNDLSTVSLSPALPIMADGASTATILVTLLSDAGQPVSGVRVNLRATGEGDVIAYLNQVSGADGIVVALIAITVAEVKTVSAHITIGQGELTIVEQPSVEFVVVPGPRNLRIINASAGTKTCSWDVVWNHPDTGGDGLIYEFCDESVGSGSTSCRTLAVGDLSEHQSSVWMGETERYTVTAILQATGQRLGSASRTKSCSVDI